MLTEKQVELINIKASIIKPCVQFARRFLVLPEIEVSFKDCPSKNFPMMDNAAESSVGPDGCGHILINGPWFADRIKDHQDDVEFFIFHELRHIHQLTQIRLMTSGKKTRESVNDVQKWKDEFNGYMRNEGGDTQLENISQEVEIDANAYGIILETIYQNGRQPLLSIPAEAVNLAEKRLQCYIDTLPEFKDYSLKNNEVVRQNVKQQPIIKGKKTGRNDPCPCGSGKKYKFCCGK